MIWTGTKQELIVFSKNLNSKHKSDQIRKQYFTQQYMIFGRIKKKKKSNLQNTTYRKFTDQTSHLHAHYPNHTHHLHTSSKIK